MKKSISIILSILLFSTIFLGLIPTVNAEEVISSDGIYEYILLDDNTIEITNYYGKESNLSIPENIDGYTVTKLGYRSFAENAWICNVSFPKTLKVIGEWAFYKCSTLEEIVVPDNIEEISELAFKDCISVKYIVFGENITRINNQTFKGCTNLEKISFSQNLSMIDAYAFEDCVSLKTISLPDSVTSIGTQAFCGCITLTDVSLSSKLITLGYGVFQNCDSLTEITLPDSLKSIGDFAFENCNLLKKIIISDSVAEFGNKVFLNCPKLMIYGNEKSHAEAYANENDIIFVEKNKNTQLSIDNIVSDLYIKEKTKLTYRITDGYGKTIISASNSDIVKVKQNGTILAKKAGKSKITVMNNGVKETFTVVVKKPILNVKRKTLSVGKKFELGITGKVGKATFMSTKTKVATVNKNGEICAKKKGNTTIKVKTNGITLKCRIKVK